MKSMSEMICFQEIPDEVCLSFAISNCPFRCEGCHSPELRTDCGREIAELLHEKIPKYKDFITCVLFLGGDDDKQRGELLGALTYCRLQGLKTALYSGQDVFYANDQLGHLLDYYKVGRYIKELGGLSSPSTNQRLYKKENGEWKDITYRFWTSEIENEN